jgi:hypothetical protein
VRLILLSSTATTLQPPEDSRSRRSNDLVRECIAPSPLRCLIHRYYGARPRSRPRAPSPPRQHTGPRAASASAVGHPQATGPRVGCTSTISLQIQDCTNGEFVGNALPAPDSSRRSRSGTSTRHVRKFLEPAGPEPSDGHPLGFSASSVWGVSARFRPQILMMPRCELSFGCDDREAAGFGCWARLLRGF